MSGSATYRPSESKSGHVWFIISDMKSNRFGTVLLCLFSSTCATAVAQLPAAPGKILNVEGTKLHINCSGTGTPAVILEAGLPGSSLDWVSVQPEVANITTVCSYDRAGLGWSGLGKQPRTGSQIAEDLHGLLFAAGLKPPYVLVGHSIGGIYVRVFTAKYPSEVIGMVLVDALNGDEPQYKLKSFWQPKRSHLEQEPRVPTIQRPPEVEAILQQLRATETWMTGERQERDAVKVTLAEMQQSEKRLPMLPLIVLSAGRQLDWTESASTSAWEHQQLQRELSTMSPQGEWIPVPDTGHYIQLSNPSVVINSIQRVVTAARSFQPAQ